MYPCRRRRHYDFSNPPDRLASDRSRDRRIDVTYSDLLAASSAITTAVQIANRDHSTPPAGKCPQLSFVLSKN